MKSLFIIITFLSLSTFAQTEPTPACSRNIFMFLVSEYAGKLLFVVNQSFTYDRSISGTPDVHFFTVTMTDLDGKTYQYEVIGLGAQSKTSECSYLKAKPLSPTFSF